MKAKDMRERTAAELEGMERDLSRELWKTRFTNFTNQLDDTAKLRRLRREIARIKTILTEKGPKTASQQDESQKSE
jgi:large subunit ribosomal protein L29